MNVIKRSELPSILLYSDKCGGEKEGARGEGLGCKLPMISFLGIFLFYLDAYLDNLLK